MRPNARPPGDVYKAQLELNKILDELKEIQKKKREEDKQRYYYIQREIYNQNKALSKVEIVSYCIYLNKAGFNGLYREKRLLQYSKRVSRKRYILMKKN